MPLTQMQLITITQGMVFSRVLQVNSPGTPPTPATGIFNATYTLSATFWLGQNQAAIFSPVVSWFTGPPTNPLSQTGYDQGQVLFQTTAAQTVALDPAGEYFATVYATDLSGNESAVIEVRVKILASPGTTTPTPPDLATYDYVAAALAGNRLTDSQRDFLPYAIAAASKRWRRWCSDRDFNQQTYTQVLPYAIDGYCRLPQIPVNQVIRVQGQLDTAITIINNSPNVQSSQVLASYTGDVESGQVITGLTLNWQSNGVANTQSILYSSLSPATINSLAAAINAVGSGWLATVNLAAPSQGYGSWSVTELYNVLVAVGTSSNVSGESQLQVFSQDISNARLHPEYGQRTGLLWVGQTSIGLGMTYGPDPVFFDRQTYNEQSIIKCTYNAGFAVIPSIVQFATAELVRVMMFGLKVNPYVMNYRAGEVSFGIANEALKAIPGYILSEMAQYRIHNA